MASDSLIRYYDLLLLMGRRRDRRAVIIMFFLARAFKDLGALLKTDYIYVLMPAEYGLLQTMEGSFFVFRNYAKFLMFLLKQERDREESWHLVSRDWRPPLVYKFCQVWASVSAFLRQ